MGKTRLHHTHYHLTERELQHLSDKFEHRKAKKNTYLTGYIGASAALGGVLDGVGGAASGFFGSLLNSWVWSKYYSTGYHLGNDQYFQPTLEGNSPVAKLTGGVAATGLALGTTVGVILAATSATSLSTGAIIGVSALIGLAGLPILLVGLIAGSKYAYNKGQKHGRDDVADIVSQRQQLAVQAPQNQVLAPQQAPKVYQAQQPREQVTQPYVPPVVAQPKRVESPLPKQDYIPPHERERILRDDRARIEKEFRDRPFMPQRLSAPLWQNKSNNNTTTQVRV